MSADLCEEQITLGVGIENGAAFVSSGLSHSSRVTNSSGNGFEGGSRLEAVPLFAHDNSFADTVQMLRGGKW